MTRLMQFNNRNGFSLVELIVAAAILAIVAASFVGLYTTGFFGVASAGLRSQNISLTQEEMERAIQVGTNTANSLTLTFSDSTTVTVQGEIIEFTNDNVAIRTFLPRK